MLQSGKVEATVRKVALVALHSLLRAGSVNREVRRKEEERKGDETTAIT